jgi:predicted GIY-YIG superfamily endonuclease
VNLNPPLLRIDPSHFERLRAETHILYRCYNRKESLLYVGMTNNPEDRFKHHRTHQPWWPYVDHITLQQYATRRELAGAEATAIQDEHPKFNVVTPTGTPTLRTPGRRSVPVWSEPSAFGSVVPEYGFLIEQTLEQQLFPCVECAARAIYCEGETVTCQLCAAEWTFEQWFTMTFS